MSSLVPGDIVLVTCGPMHSTGRVEAENPIGSWATEGVWVDVNMLGTHLAQRYQPEEIQRIDRPSEFVTHGLCPYCAGYGVIDVLLHGPTACMTCGGSGRTGVKVMITFGPQQLTAEVSTEGVSTSEITCPSCEEAFRRRL